MGTDLVARQPLSMDLWNVIQAIAPTMHASRLFSVSSPEQAATIALKGAELGLGLAASYEYISVIQGRPTLAPRGALAIALNSGQVAAWKIEDRNDANGQPYSCYVWMRRKNGLEYGLEFTMDDARRAGLVKPDGAWSCWPKSMLKWRAVGFVLDTIMPDICGGMRRADELGATVDDRGDVVAGEWRPAEAATPTPQAATPTPQPTPNGAEPTPPPAAPAQAVPTQPEQPTLQSLVDKYSAEAVMTAAGGRIPGTVEEVATVAAILDNAARLSSAAAAGAQ